MTQIKRKREFEKDFKMYYAGNYCAVERPVRKTFCQLPKGHKGEHRAVIFWSDE